MLLLLFDFLLFLSNEIGAILAPQTSCILLQRISFHLQRTVTKAKAVTHLRKGNGDRKVLL